MRLTDLIDKVKVEASDDRHRALARDREAILKTLRKGLNEEQYQALAVVLVPHVEGYSLTINRREYILYQENDVWGRTTRVKSVTPRFMMADNTKVLSGMGLLRWLAGRD